MQRAPSLLPIWRVMPEAFRAVSYEASRTVTAADVEHYAQLTGDWNPLHFRLDKPIVHGGLLVGWVSGVIGQHFPGAMLLQLDAKFSRSCLVGSQITVQVEVGRWRRITDLQFRCFDPADTQHCFMNGTARILLAKEMSLCDTE